MDFFSPLSVASYPVGYSVLLLWMFLLLLLYCCCGCFCYCFCIVVVVVFVIAFVLLLWLFLSVCVWMGGRVCGCCARARVRACVRACVRVCVRCCCCCLRFKCYLLSCSQGAYRNVYCNPFRNFASVISDFCIFCCCCCWWFMMLNVIVCVRACVIILWVRPDITVLVDWA